jgi:hypothetical protein
MLQHGQFQRVFVAVPEYLLHGHCGIFVLLLYLSSGLK